MRRVRRPIRRPLGSGPPLVGLLAGLCSAALLAACFPPPEPVDPKPPFERLAKAEPDECFVRTGGPTPRLVRDGGGRLTCVDPASGRPLGRLKVNAGYVWGLAETADRFLWLGTGANVQCLVFGGVFGLDGPLQTPHEVCEFGESQLARDGVVPAPIGDWRPPHAYRYDLVTGELREITPGRAVAERTLGFRWAGASPDGRVVFLGGPANTDPVGGITVAAYDAATGALLASGVLPEFTDVRKSVVHGGVLYVGVRNATTGGSVLRWVGDVRDPLRFEVVGALDGEASELAVHEGRLFAATAPNGPRGAGTPPPEAAIFRSPPIPPGGLTGAHAAQWSALFRASDYEPDPVAASTYSFGALASFDGKLVFGTTLFPLTTALVHLAVYGDGSPTLFDVVANAIVANRALALFELADAGSSTPRVSLLYGETKLSTWVPDVAGDPKGPGAWRWLPNRLGQRPRFGASGFNNAYNAYTWNMVVHDGSLYVGTFDWSYLLADILRVLPRQPDSYPLGNGYGADLLRFDSLAQPAVMVDANGAGNPLNYGIRTSASIGGDLYLGTANPMNLATAAGEPRGGWELVRMG